MDFFPNMDKFAILRHTNTYMSTRIQIEVSDDRPAGGMVEKQVSAQHPRTGEIDLVFGHVLPVKLVELFQLLEFHATEDALVTAFLGHDCLHILA